MATGLVARQPIFDRRGRVFGYELLYRGMRNTDQGWDGDRASSSVLLDFLTSSRGASLMEEGTEKAFINLTRNLLADFAHLPLSKEQMVLEVLEDIEVNDRFLELAGKLSRSGYCLALDDFVLSDSNRDLIDYADIIKVDIQQLTRQGLQEHAAQLGQYPVRLLAEKVETHEERSVCEELGFHYFQGFFFARPEVFSSGRLPPDRLRMLQLLERIHDPDVQLDELANLIAQDVTLSYSLLRLINSAYFPTRTRIDSVQRALTYLGLEGARTWLTWTAMAGIEDKPRELRVHSLMRARMAGRLGEMRGENADSSFLVGLLSSLDALMDRPLRDLLDQLPLAESVRGALLTQEGPLGEVLTMVLAYERGQWERVREWPLAPEQVADAYLDALDWAEGITRQLEQAA
jgi:EAL and modified HD-GYP domain-containing signal transduction protein